ncbi:MAG: hypothetical protein GY851_17055, partial [bacterium]|nr:hypothetical protein [bacterium]
MNTRRMVGWMWFALVVIGALGAGEAVAAGAAGPKPVQEQEAKTPVPGLPYGATDALPLPRTILFTGDYRKLEQDAAEWKRRGIDAFFLYGVAREWS